MRVIAERPIEVAYWSVSDVCISACVTALNVVFAEIGRLSYPSCGVRGFFTTSTNRLNQSSTRAFCSGSRSVYLSPRSAGGTAGCCGTHAETAKLNVRETQIAAIDIEMVTPMRLIGARSYPSHIPSLPALVYR